MKAEKKPNFEFGEENICPQCGNEDIHVETRTYSENKDIQEVSKTCKCGTRWGYNKNLKNGNINDRVITQ